MPITIKELHKQLRGNYSAFWNEDRDALASRVLKKLFDEIGPARTEACVYACIQYETSFNEEILRRHIPEAPKSKHVHCDRCRDSEGWIYVLVDGDRSKMPRAIRCDHTTKTHFRVIVGPDSMDEKRNAVACDFVERIM